MTFSSSSCSTALLHDMSVFYFECSFWAADLSCQCGVNRGELNARRTAASGCCCSMFPSTTAHYKHRAQTLLYGPLFYNWGTPQSACWNLNFHFSICKEARRLLSEVKLGVILQETLWSGSHIVFKKLISFWKWFCIIKYYLLSSMLAGYRSFFNPVLRSWPAAFLACTLSCSLD